MKERRTFIDRVVTYFDPVSGARRAQARLLEERLVGLRKYEGASQSSRTKGWVTGGTSANTEIQGALAVLRNRSRDLVRNDGYGQRAVALIQSNVIGNGIIPQARHRTESRADKTQDLWSQWGETTDCDFTGLHDFYGLQGLIARCMAESGECLIRRQWMRSSDNLAVPMQLQILEPDYINTLRTNERTEQGGYIIQGIEFDSRGKIVAYWLFDRHPGDVGIPFATLIAKRVPATELIHLFRVDRAGQIRGVPWAAPSLITIRDFNEYQDAQLQRQKIAACFSAFIRDSDASLENSVSGLGGDDDDGDDQLSHGVRPGMMVELPEGKDITFASPPGVDGYSDYARVVLRGIAVGFGLTYEALTGDYSNVNFSSGRMGWIEMQRNIEQWQYQLIVPRLCNRVWKWFTEAAELAGHDEAQGVTSEWTPPRRQMINPREEIASMKDAVRNGFMTWNEGVRSLGYDPKKQVREIEATNKVLDQAKITLDCDPRKVTEGGQAQIQPGQGGQGPSQAKKPGAAAAPDSENEGDEADPAESDTASQDPAPAKRKPAKRSRKLKKEATAHA